jgi:hypothetical protein
MFGGNKLMLVCINSENEIVSVGTVAEGLTAVEISSVMTQIDNYQKLQDFKLTFDDDGNVNGRIIRGFKGEIENLWNTRKEYQQRVSDLETLVLELGGII